MKKKEIKEITKQLAKNFHKELNNNNNNKKNYVKSNNKVLGPPDLIKEDMEREGFFIDYDKETSDKFYNFMINLVRLRDRLSIYIGTDSISISGDIEYDTPSSQVKRKLEDFIEIKVDKNGFKLFRSSVTNNHLYFKDENILEKLLPAVIEKNKSISKSMAMEIIDDIMTKTNLSRESNLEKLGV